MSKEKLTHNQKDAVLTALFYYRDTATHSNENGCGCGLPKGRERRTLNQAIDKIVRYM